MTTVFLINGFNVERTTAQSEKIIVLQNKLKAMGYRVALTNISWRGKAVLQFAKEFKALYATHKTEHNIIIGNSFGAIVALLTAADLRPDRLYLCSLSAFFSEDRAQRSDGDDIERFGEECMREFWSLSFAAITQKYAHLALDITITYGEKEKKMHPLLVRRCKAAAEALPHARLIELPHAPHSIGDPVYIEQLIKYIPNTSRLDQNTAVDE
jgi:pimeloyl-ACP methyl ester carboxylesterase